MNQPSAFPEHSSFRPKMVFLPSRYFCPKMLVCFICMARNLRVKVKHFLHQTFIIKKLFDTATSGDVSEQLLFSILRVILTTTGQWSAGLTIAKVRNSYNHFGTEGVLGRTMLPRSFGKVSKFISSKFQYHTYSPHMC